MEGIKQQRGQDFEPIVFESVIDTVAGGGTIDVTGYTNADNLILAGLPVGFKKSNGTHEIITPAKITADQNDLITILGYVHKTVAIDSNPVVGIVTEGTLRAAMLQAGYDKDYLMGKTPKVTII